MIEYAVACEIGDQEENEDTVRVFLNPRLGVYGFVLADGLGGHGGGKQASSLVTEYVGNSIEITEGLHTSFIDECFVDAQVRLSQEAEYSGHTSMRTTMVLMLLDGKIAQWGHIGDSRLYYFRDGKLIRQTLDHSVPQMLANSGKIRNSAIRHHPDRSKLLHAMGGSWDGPEYEIDERRRPVRPGDSFLLCSDGFWDWITEKTMAKMIKKGNSAQSVLDDMIREVRQNGFGKNMDNYSAILIMVK